MEAPRHHSLWDALPMDVRALILDHRAACAVQQAWRRHAHFAHARHAAWEEVRLHLRALGAWPELARYANARREWRSEPRSWLATDARFVREILQEARAGTWGTASPLLGGA